MLKTISPLLDGDILKILSDMGHGDELLIADANFPAARYGRTVVRSMGCTSVQMLDSVLTLMPLDHLVQPVFLMALSEGDSILGRPEVWSEYETVLERHGFSGHLDWYEYRAFYEAASNCYAIVQTGETALYGNIILRKGAISPEA